MISRVSGKWVMYLVSLHGHATSSAPGASGAPTLCRALTKPSLSSMRSSACLPIRVMIRIETTTYAESVICTPSREIGEPSGPMQNGTTYIVRPCITPVKCSRRVWRISSGSAQLLVGPASSGRAEQM